MRKHRSTPTDKKVVGIADDAHRPTAKTIALKVARQLGSEKPMPSDRQTFRFDTEAEADAFVAGLNFAVLCSGLSIVSPTSRRIVIAAPARSLRR